MRHLRKLLLVGLVLNVVPSMVSAQDRGILDWEARPGSIDKKDPVDHNDRRYVEYMVTGLTVGDSLRVAVIGQGFTPRIDLYDPDEWAGDGTPLRRGYYVATLITSNHMMVRVIAENPGQTGKYIVKRMAGNESWELPEFESVSRVGGLAIGANLHNSKFKLEGDDWAWTGAGYAVRGALGFGDHLVLHAEYQNVLASPDDDAPAAVADEIWELKDLELGARLYLLSAQSYLRPYVMGAYAFRNAEVNDDEGIKGPGYVAGGGVEFFFLRSLTLEIGGTYSWGDFDKFYIGDQEFEPSEVGETPFPATHRRLSFGFAWHM